jgi:serine/threonine-protein kinase
VVQIGGPELLPPRYEDAQRVAAGGMSEVLRATDGVLGRTVAVKILGRELSANEDARKRFAREARAAARLSDDPCTVTVFDVGEWEGRPYLVMEYLSGGTVEHIIRDGPIPSVGRTLQLLARSASALDHAHAQGVVHRDVKPGNLLLDDRGDLFVADFGIARVAGLEALTVAGTILGTSGYLAPEQAAGGTATPASDRYGLAVVAYELLTGTRPFRRDSPAEEVVAQATSPVPSAAARNATLPDGVDPVFERALAVDPVRRYPSCGAFLDDLRESLADGWPIRDSAEPTLVIPPPTRRSRSLSPFLLAAGLVVAGIAGAFVLTGGHGTASAPPVTVRVTVPPRTVTEQTTTAAPPAAGSTGTGLIARGESLLASGRALEALPLLQQANNQLNASGTTGEARADTDLAVAIVGVRSCNGVVSLVDRADQIIGPTPKTAALRAACTGPPGHRPGHHKD